MEKCEFEKEYEMAIRCCKHIKETSNTPHIIASMAFAIEALEKQIPEKPIIEPWTIAKCPSCKTNLGESLKDGYVKNWTSKKVCDCGQLLDWNNDSELFRKPIAFNGELETQDITICVAPCKLI